MNNFTRDPFTHKWFQTCPSERRSYRELNMVCQGWSEHLPPRQNFRLQIYLPQQHRMSDVGLISNEVLI